MLVCHYLALLHTTSKWFNITVMEGPPQDFNEGLLKVTNMIITDENTRRCDVLIRYRNLEYFGKSCERRKRGHVDLRRLCILSDGPRGGGIMMTTNISCHRPAEVYFDPGDNSHKVATNSMTYILMTYHGLMPEVVTSLEKDPQEVNYTTSEDNNTTMSFDEAIRRIRTSRTWGCHKTQALIFQTVVIILIGIFAVCTLVCLSYTSFIMEEQGNTTNQARPRTSNNVTTRQNDILRRPRTNAMGMSYSNSYQLSRIDDVPPPYSA